MSFAVQTNNQYAYLDEAYPGANNVLQHVPKSDDPKDPSIAKGDDAGLFGEDGFGFDDFLDIINPLQHLPVISSLYREFTGDTISAGSRMIGGGIFGGGIGLAASIVNTAVQSETGKDIGGHVIALFTDDDEIPNDASQIAAKSQTIEAAPLQSQVAATLPVMQIDAKQANKAPPTIEETALAFKEGRKPELFMGLQWKGKAPDLTANIENAKALQQDNLSDNQKSQILGAFRLSPANSATIGNVAPSNQSPGPEKIAPSTMKGAATVYEKQVSVTPQAQENTAKNIGENFSYLNKLV